MGNDPLAGLFPAYSDCATCAQTSIPPGGGSGWGYGSSSVPPDPPDPDPVEPLYSVRAETAMQSDFTASPITDYTISGRVSWESGAGSIVNADGESSAGLSCSVPSEGTGSVEGMFDELEKVFTFSIPHYTPAYPEGEDVVIRSFNVVVHNYGLVPIWVGLQGFGPVLQTQVFPGGEWHSTPHYDSVSSPDTTDFDSKFTIIQVTAQPT